MTSSNFTAPKNLVLRQDFSERVSRIELPCSPWQGDVLPLNYTRKWRFWRDSNSRSSPWQGDEINHYSTEPMYGEERGIWTLAPVSRPMPLAGAPLRPLEYFLNFCQAHCANFLLSLSALTYNTKPPIIMQVLFQNIFKKVFSSEVKG